MMEQLINGSLNPYIPFDAEIIDIEDLNPDSKRFILKLSKSDFYYEPGQFVKLTLYGVGEAAIGVTDTIFDEGFEMAVRNTGGLVTSSLHKMKTGDIVGLRGPFGRPFPLNNFIGKNILFIGAGIGLWPIRSCIKYILKHRNNYGELQVMVGVREPKLFSFSQDIQYWIDRDDMTVMRTVDGCCEVDDWEDNIGLITTLTDRFSVDNPEDWIVLMCGPPFALKHIGRSLNNNKILDSQIWVSLERRMQCGIGKCNHCLIGGATFVCVDGPVFRFSEVKALSGGLD
jgi:NAD(P)H-flavin reductase